MIKIDKELELFEDQEQAGRIERRIESLDKEIKRLIQERDTAKYNLQEMLDRDRAIGYHLNMTNREAD